MTLGIEREGLAEQIVDLAAWHPDLRNPAGMIVLDRDHLGILDAVSRRNASGRQLRSFEAHLELQVLPDGPLRAMFIRAPWVYEHGPAVQALATVDGHPVAIRRGNVVATAFRPELAGDLRLHELLLKHSQHPPWHAGHPGEGRVAADESHDLRLSTVPARV